MRGLSVGEESDVKVCFVVSWKKMGCLRRDCEESERSWSFSSPVGFSAGFNTCFKSALSAFRSCVYQHHIMRDREREYLSLV